MYTTKTRKWYIVTSLILATVLCFLGTFLIFRPKRITASAVESGNRDMIYFKSGADVYTDDSGRHKMQFTMYVNMEVFNTGTLTINLTGSDHSAFVDEECCWVHGGGEYVFRVQLSGPSGTGATVTDTQISGINREDFESDVINRYGAWWEVALAITTSDTDDYLQLCATINQSGTLTNAYSDELSWESAGDTVIVVGSTLTQVLGERVTEYAESVNVNALSLYEKAWIDTGNGLSLIGNVPTSYQDLINQGVTYEDGAVLDERIGTEYCLVLARGGSGLNTQNFYDNAYETYEYHKDGLPVMGNATTFVFRVPFGVDGGYYTLLLRKRTWTEVRYIFNGWKTKGNDTYTTVTGSEIRYVNVKTLAEEILSMGLSLEDYEQTYLQDIAGTVPSTEMVTVKVQYKALANKNDPTSVITAETSFTMKAVQAYSKAFAISSMYGAINNNYIGDEQGNDTTVRDISDFNVVYSGKYTQSGTIYGTGDRIILQAKDLEYEYNADEETGYMTVVYNDFQYKDLGIRIKCNDPQQIGITAWCYTAQAEVGETTTKLTFDLSRLKTQLYSSFKWIVDEVSLSLDITGVPEGVSTTYLTDTVYVDEKQDNGTTIKVPKEYISHVFITFPNDKENELVNLSITGVANIVPDITYSCVYNYMEIDINANGEIAEKWKTSQPFEALYTKTMSYENTYTNFTNEFGSVISDALFCKDIDGEYCEDLSVDVDYEMLPSDAEEDGKTASGEMPTCVITVQYRYNATFKITNNLNDTVKYKVVDNTNRLYKGDYFANPIPKGYRVDYIETDSRFLTLTEGEKKEDHTQTVIQVGGDIAGLKNEKILPVHVVYTDKWFVVVNWMSPYKNTPFAVKTATETEIRVLDYPDIYALTKEDVAKILGRKDMSVMGLVQANTPKVGFDGVARYTIDITYGEASLKQIDYDGHANEIKVPLTSYVDWCKSFGENWTILYLNTQDTKYFQYSNEVNREDLYGFFAVAVFEEQVSDLNYWFRNNTGDGQMTIFSSRAVEGSSLYKFFDNMTTKGIVSKAIGTLGMMLCETIDDSNKIYQSYYFYLDGNSDNAYISNGGADNAFDNDSALENKGEDIVDDVKDGWDKLTGKGKGLWQKFRESRWDTVVFIVLGVIAGVIVLGISLKYGKRFYIWVTAEPKKKTAKKRKKAGKKK